MDELQRRHTVEVEHVRHGLTQELQAVPFTKVPSMQEDTHELLSRYNPLLQLMHRVMFPLHDEQLEEHGTQLPLIGIVVGSVQTDRQLFW